MYLQEFQAILVTYIIKTAAHIRVHTEDSKNMEGQEHHYNFKTSYVKLSSDLTSSNLF